MVDAGLVQRLTARAEVGVQRTPEGARPMETVELEQPRAVAEVTSNAQAELSTSAPGPDEQPPLSTWTLPAQSLPMAPATVPSRDVDAPARAPVGRSRGAVPFELPLAPRQAVVQREVVRGETKVGEPPEQTFAVETTTDARGYVRRALAEEVSVELQTPEEPLALLDDDDMMQLAQEVLPIVKRLLRTELERRSQPDLDW